MIAVSLLFALSPVSALYGYSYGNTQCTGDKLSGLSGPTDSCYGGNQMFKCNSTHATLNHYTGQQCTGDVYWSEYVEIGVCTNYTKVYCTGDPDPAPEGSIGTHLYNDATKSCSGTEFSVWQKQNVCMPDIDDDKGLLSRKLKYDNTTNMVTTTTWLGVDDCTGSSDDETSPIFALSYDYSSSSSSESGFIGVNFYSQSDCTGNIYNGQGYVSNLCLYGVKAWCQGNTFFLLTQGGDNCSDQSQVLNFTAGTCINGLKGFCTGDLMVPANSYSFTQYEKGCDGMKQYTQFWLTGTCVVDKGVTSHMLSYNDSTHYIDSTVYQTTDCTGPSDKEPQQMLSSAAIVINPAPPKPSSASSLLPTLSLFFLLATTLFSLFSM